MIDDCFLHDKDRLRHEDAIAILKSRLAPLANPIEIPLESATRQVLAKTIRAPNNIPAFNNSAVDGYAFSSQDLSANGGVLEISERIIAGEHRHISLRPGQSARIFTGAPMPQYADTVAMQEDCSRESNSNRVKIPTQLKLGANVRLAGEDVKQGDTIAPKGTILNPQDIAAIASCGLQNIEIFCPLKIALASTGNEIIRPGRIQKNGQVYDANYYMIASLLENLPVDVTDLGILPDERQGVEDTLGKAAKSHDIVITSGGASRGSEDHVTHMLAEKGTRHMWQLAIKPGRPMCFGQLNDTLFFGLPGNPVASFVCFLLYVRPSLLRLGGAEWIEPLRYQIPAGFDFSNKKTDRREYWRGCLTSDDNQNLVLNKFERDGSGLISGLQQSDGLIEIHENTRAVKKGELLNFIPYAQFGIYK